MSRNIPRRTFLTAATAAVGGTTVVDSIELVAAESGSVGDCDADPVPDLVFNETSSLLDANYDRLKDDEIVFVFSEGTADAGSYDDEEVPLWAKDGTIYGSGSLLVDDDEDNGLDYGQDAVLLNVVDSYADGSGHIVYDESAGQEYTLHGRFSKFRDWVRENGYSIEASSDLAEGLVDADALLVTLPGEEHAADQVDAIREFAADGNPVFLFNEAASWDTDVLNSLAERLELAYRFAEDEVTDEPGWEWDDWPITGNYDDETYPEYFENREGIGFEPGTEYAAEVVEVVDADTFDVRITGGYHDGEEERVRHLGVDTPETGSADNNPDEWIGIEDEKWLDDWGSEAAAYAEDSFDAGDAITFWVDEREFPRGNYGRLLAYHTYPEDGDDADVTYNRDLIEKGYAKPYDTSFSEHDRHTEAFRSARENDRRVWAESDPDATEERWNRDVETLAFRKPTSVVTVDEQLESHRTAVWAEPSAEQDLGDDGIAYDGDIPLVGVDSANRIALVGGLMNADAFEDGDDENFVFNANLADELSDVGHDDRYLIEGGHGQFDVSYDFGKEGKETFLRFLEGLDGMEFQGINALTEEYLNTDEGHAIVITPPAGRFCYTDAEIGQLRQFRDDGGAVVLRTSRGVDPESTAILDELAAALGTDLRFNDDAVTDSDSNKGGADEPETSNFNVDRDLFEAYDHDGPTGDGDDDDDCHPPGQC
ncbi:thermonuclease family protein [Natronococcus wangiae]|uniref:thermonuclease family protein n=1 Tax=Natronococcus wangiae TaxID=3068275 RepID=UPI00273FC1A2|nr:thermonuclease family protein [Natronococcus sp. AD5]